MTSKKHRVNSHPIKRRVNFRPIVQRFLIVCEGKKTEKIYFESFKVPGDIKQIDVHGLGMNTLSLVKEAIKLKKVNEYNQVWCVFDVEDFEPEDIREAMILAKHNGIQIACSNQKFEIWFLLHFVYCSSGIDRKQYDKILSENLGFPYEKDSNLYQIINPLQEIAIRNAIRLLNQYDKYDPASNNPSTTVHLLVQELNKFSPDSRRY